MKNIELDLDICKEELKTLSNENEGIKKYNEKLEKELAKAIEASKNSSDNSKQKQKITSKDDQQLFKKDVQVLEKELNLLIKQNNDCESNYDKMYHYANDLEKDLKFSENERRILENTLEEERNISSRELYASNKNATVSLIAFLIALGIAIIK